LRRFEQNLARARDADSGDKNVGPAGKPGETLHRRFQIVRLMKKNPLEQQGLIGADAQSLRTPLADVKRLGPGEQHCKIGWSAAAFQKPRLESPLIDIGGLNFDFQAGVLQQKSPRRALRGEHGIGLIDP